MTTAQEILKLIETVDPSDSAKLDEIDARVWCWLSGYEYTCKRISPNYTERGHFFINNGEVILVSWRPQYTRSRDALKAIRPKGYFICGNDGQNPDQFRCEILTGMKAPTIFAYGATEELAELHAIIAAIDYERQQGDKQ